MVGTSELSHLQWHTLTIEEICEQLASSPSTGLDTTKVPELTVTYGANIPTPPPNRILHKLFMYCFGGFGVLLLGGGILVLIAWKPLGNPPAIANLALGIVLLLVFAIQALFNAWQDYSSFKVMNSIKTMLPDECLVLRDGSQQEISAIGLVPGDVVYVRLGDKIAADLRMMEVSMDLKFDKSILTGISPFTIDLVRYVTVNTHQVNRDPSRRPSTPQMETTSKPETSPCRELIASEEAESASLSIRETRLSLAALRSCPIALERD